MCICVCVCVACRATTLTFLALSFSTLFMYIYIYIYICVCVYVRFSVAGYGGRLAKRPNLTHRRNHKLVLCPMCRVASGRAQIKKQKVKKRDQLKKRGVGLGYRRMGYRHTPSISAVGSFVFLLFHIHKSLGKTGLGFDALSLSFMSKHVVIICIMYVTSIVVI